MAPQRKIFEKSFDLKEMSVTFGTNSRVETYRIEGMSRDAVNVFILNGFAQTLTEKCESSAGSLTEDEQWAAMNEVYAHLQSGTMWNRLDSVRLVRALCELAPHKTHDEIRVEVERWTKEERIDVAMNPKVFPVLRRMEAEDAPNAKKAANIVSDYLLEGLVIQQSAPAEPTKPWWKWWV